MVRLRHSTFKKHFNRWGAVTGHNLEAETQRCTVWAQIVLPRDTPLSETKEGNKYTTNVKIFPAELSSALVKNLIQVLSPSNLLGQRKSCLRNMLLKYFPVMRNRLIENRLIDISRHSREEDEVLGINLVHSPALQIPSCENPKPFYHLADLVFPWRKLLWCHWSHNVIEKQ